VDYIIFALVLIGLWIGTKLIFRILGGCFRVFLFLFMVSLVGGCFAQMFGGS
jgi:hypothetical protein